MSLLDATNEAIGAAAHLGPMDAGAVEALRDLARKIDAWDVIVEWALDDIAGGGRDSVRPAVPANDNTSLPTYLKFCESLGLTPAGRGELAGVGKGKQPKVEAGGGKKLSSLGSLPRPA